MENLYKLDEFIGELPNPRSFPIRGAIIYAINGRPYTFADGFMIDLSVKEKDKEILEGKASRTLDVWSINSQIKEAKRAELLLSEPEFIEDTTYPAYVLFTPEGNPVLIQIKYYKYFRNRYPECGFYLDKEDSKLVAIKMDKEVVGVCMLMFYGKETLVLIKEERK